MTSTLPSRPTKSTDEPDHRSRQDSTTEKKPPLELSIAQVVGGALAAMTAAFLGSTLGTGGTILGAALASIVAGVAGAVYTASLRRTGHQVRRVFVATGPTDASEPTGVLERVHDTTVLPAQPVPAAAARPTPPKGPFALRAAFVTIAVFLLAGAGLTGYELLTGHALAGGNGTTITQVGDSGGAPKKAPAKSETPAPSAQPTDDATPATSSEAPNPAPTDSAEPTEPTPESTEASPTPSATATPDTGENP